VLFSGTLRLNLDPFDSHTDDELWKILEMSHLKNFVSGLEEGLLYPVSEGGENLRYCPFVFRCRLSGGTKQRVSVQKIDTLL